MVINKPDESLDWKHTIFEMKPCETSTLINHKERQKYISNGNILSYTVTTVYHDEDIAGLNGMTERKYIHQFKP